MTDICERRLVHLPERDAALALASFVAACKAGGGNVRVALFARHGVAEFYALCSSSDPYPTYSVTWAPRAGHLFPDFAGALAVERLPTPDRFGLILSGHYEPPLGTFGAAFDIVIGRRVAHATAQDLLRAIVHRIEAPLPRADVNAGAARAPTAAGDRTGRWAFGSGAKPT